MSNKPYEFQEICGTCKHSSVIGIDILWCVLLKSYMRIAQWCPKWERMTSTWTKAE